MAAKWYPAQVFHHKSKQREIGHIIEPLFCQQTKCYLVTNQVKNQVWFSRSKFENKFSDRSAWKRHEIIHNDKRNLAVQIVKRSSQTGVLGRDMKELIMIEIYSAAQSV